MCKHMRAVAMFTLLCFCWTILLPGLLPAQTTTNLDEARRLYKEGRLEKARAALDKLIAEWTGKADMEQSLADAYFLRAKIFIDVLENAKSEADLHQLFLLLPNYYFPGDDPEFKTIAERIRSEVKRELERKVQEALATLRQQKDREQKEAEIKRQAEERAHLDDKKKAEELRQADEARKKDAEQKKAAAKLLEQERLRLDAAQKAEAARLDEAKRAEALKKAKDAKVVTVVEKEGPPQVKKKKSFPWLLFGLGIVAVGVLAYFLLIKKSTTSSSPYSNGVLTINGVRYEMAAISGGNFQMGSDSADAFIDENPVHTVTISAFYMGKTEVTQGLWKAVMGTNPSHNTSGDNYPVDQVSWDDCQAFFTKLNQMVGGSNFRMPTEAEWEYACRAGTTGDRYGDLDAIAWYSKNSGLATHPVSQKQANAWGLYDMLGNVWEWCSDWYDAEYYHVSPTNNPTGPATGSSRVLRGGCWGDFAWVVRSTRRVYDLPSLVDNFVGFRLAAISAGN